MTDNEMRYYLEILKGGNWGRFAQFPKKRGTADLLEELKDKGFISRDTKIGHFRVLFGVPIRKTDYPFVPIVWLKNGQLLRYFMYNIIPEAEYSDVKFMLVYQLFVNRRGKKMTLPYSDKKRLEYSADFPTLEKLLNEFY